MTMTMTMTMTMYPGLTFTILGDGKHLQIDHPSERTTIERFDTTTGGWVFSTTNTSPGPNIFRSKHLVDNKMVLSDAMFVTLRM
jgi:hypothetical protein